MGTSSANRGSLTQRVSLGAALILTAFLASLWTLKSVSAQAMLYVRQAGSAVEIVAQVRDLHAPVMRLLAYAQLVYQGDRTFQEALAQQIQLVDQSFERLERQVGVMAPSQWSLLKQAQADWHETRGALQELLPLTELPMERRLSLREALRARSNSLQRALEGLEREAQAQRAALTDTALRWSGWVDRAAWVLFLSWLAAGAGFWVFLRRRVLWPLEQLARAAEALTRGDLSFRMPRGSGADTEALASSFNAMAESLQRSQEHASL